MLPLACSPSKASAEAECAGALTTVHDPARNLITVVGEGFWSLDYIRKHIRDFETVLLRARDLDRPSRTLVDLRDAAIQSPEVAQLLHDAMCRMYRAPERAALIVASNLMKMQMKRGFNPETHAVFISASAAQLWLGA